MFGTRTHAEHVCGVEEHSTELFVRVAEYSHCSFGLLRLSGYAIFSIFCYFLALEVKPIAFSFVFRSAEPPVIHTQPGTLDVIVNNPVLLPCEATGTPRPVITWQKEGINIVTTGILLKPAAPACLLELRNLFSLL